MLINEIILHEFKIEMPGDDEGMGIPRSRMPQIKSKDYPEYFKYLKDNGVNFEKIEGVKAATLKPIQAEFSEIGVEKQLAKIFNKDADGNKPLIASSDNYIIDGHHRWLVARNTRRPLSVFKADVEMRELLDLTNKFPKVYYKDIYNEGYKLQLERDDDLYVLHITDTETNKRTEVRGKSGYESGNYDANDKLHQLLDRIGKAANISDLINGEVVGINPKHPDGEHATASADRAFKETSKTSIKVGDHTTRGGTLTKTDQTFDGGYPVWTYEPDPHPQPPKIRPDNLRIKKPKNPPVPPIRNEANEDNQGPRMDPKAVEFDVLSDAEKRRMAGEYKKIGPEMAVTSWGAGIAQGVANYLGSQHLSQLELTLVKQGLRLATENFADGKVKGKSRPGRVKRAGASCNGSVTELRKKAKNASGEKAKMYHWCANMKAGKKK
jgi:hypothetical protein